jgi:hypothetical protein
MRRYRGRPGADNMALRHAWARGTPQRRGGALHALKSNRGEKAPAEVGALSGAYRVFAAHVDQIRAGIASPRQQAPIEFNPRADWARIGFVGLEGLFGFEKHDLLVRWRIGPQPTEMTLLFVTIYFCECEIDRAKTCENYSFAVIDGIVSKTVSLEN